MPAYPDQAARARARLEAQVVGNYLSELGRKKYQDIARALKVPLERVHTAAQFIATLQPRPGSAFSSDDKQNIVQAELSVQKVGGEWVVVMNDDPVPRLRISDTYKDLLVNNGHDASLRRVPEGKNPGRGKFLIKCACSQRQTTIFNIATEIVKRQRAFFDRGRGASQAAHHEPGGRGRRRARDDGQPRDCQQMLQTPCGLFDLKYFFHFRLPDGLGAR